MGCNFYTQKSSEENWGTRYQDHIGKRSAAGMYCWDCNVSLHKLGENEVHNTHGIYKGHDLNQMIAEREEYWYDKCPECGQRQKEETLTDSSAGRELGFNKNPPEKKTGVASCLSFSWAMKPDHFARNVVEVWDEYSRQYTLKEFKKILEECPIRFYELIGKEFS